MKFLLLALFVAVATAAPIDDDSGPVEVIVNGVSEGEALEIGHIVDIRLKEHVEDKLVASSNLLHPFTAVGLAEAAAAAAAEEAALEPEPILIPTPVLPVFPSLPEPVIIPEPVLPGNPGAPAPVILPEPVLPGNPGAPAPVILPEPVLPGNPGAPAPIILPEPILPVLPISPPEPEIIMDPGTVLPVVPLPEIILEPEIIVEPVEELPAPAPQIPNGEIFNDGIVQVNLNAPQDAGVFATVQSWFNMVVNYFSNGVQSTQQIV